MRTLVAFLLMTGAAWSADYHLERAAKMIVDQTFCQRDYSVSDFQKHLSDSAAARGVSYDQAANDLKAVSANQWVRIQSGQGMYAYCANLR